jgi:DNA-binding MarR family transcriptional regulator
MLSLPTIDGCGKTKAVRESSKNRVAKALLQTISGLGDLAIDMLMPDAYQRLHLLGIDRRRSQNRYYINQVAKRLVKQDLVRLEKNKDGIVCVRLTTKGQHELERYETENLSIKKPRRWDGKYRVIIFDIKEWKRGVRDDLRLWLIRLGFIKLQNSVWVFPYECQGVVTLLKSYFKVGREVLYMTVETIENDQWIRKEFGLD